MVSTNRLRVITIKKTVILLIETPILYPNTAKTGLWESYDQEISGFIDRNLGRDVKVRPRGVHEESREGGREGERERGRERYIQCRVTPDRHHRWRIRLASDSKQAALATPTARSACFVPQSAYQDFTKQMTFHSRLRWCGT